LNLDSLPQVVRRSVGLLDHNDIEMVTETYWRATHYRTDVAAASTLKAS